MISRRIGILSHFGNRLLLLAPSRHAGRRLVCLLTGEDRKYPVHRQNVANDPKPTSPGFQCFYPLTVITDAAVRIAMSKLDDRLGC
jgi:hypothetical protein